MIERFNSFIVNEKLSTTNTINIKDIILEKEIILVDTSNINSIIKASKDGKMPLDKLRVETMADKIKNGGKLPPVTLYKNNHLKNGHHRFAAYKLLNKQKVPFQYFINNI